MQCTSSCFTTIITEALKNVSWMIIKGAGVCEYITRFMLQLTLDAYNCYCNEPDCFISRISSN